MEIKVINNIVRVQRAYAIFKNLKAKIIKENELKNTVSIIIY